MRSSFLKPACHRIQRAELKTEKKNNNKDNESTDNSK